MVLLCALALCSSVLAQPTTKPADADFVMTKMRVQGYKAVEAHAYSEVETTLADIQNGAAAGEGYKVRRLDSIRAATVVMSGSLASISDAYQELFNQLFAAGHTPAGESREIYAFWEGPESVNNVIIIQVAVR